MWNLRKHVKQPVKQLLIARGSMVCCELLLGSQKPVKYPVKHPVIYSAKYREVVMSTEACETPHENMREKQMLLWEYKQKPVEFD